MVVFDTHRAVKTLTAAGLTIGVRLALELLPR